MSRDHEHTVTLASPVPGALADELRKRVYFVDPRIVGFSLLSTGDVVVGVRVTTDRPAATEELSRRLDRMVARDVLTQRPPRQIVRWRSARQDLPVRPAFDELVAKGLAFTAGEGQIGVAQPVLRLIDRLDALLRDIAIDEFGGAEYRYPTLIPAATLRRSGYLSSFPQHVMFTTWLHGVSYQDLGDAELLAGCTPVRYCLPPTMCYHTYQQLARSTLAAESRVITARGKSFRFESRYHADLERLWDFTIREVVFLGTQLFAEQCRARFLSRTTELLDSLELVGHCEVAHDPFFGTESTGQAIVSQRLHELKYEARLAVCPDRTIAVGSFNLHGDRFGEAFDIRLPTGETARTACVGFGLERLAYAVLCQHGVAERGWPHPLR